MAEIRTVLRRRLDSRGEAGLTLIEMLVAMAMFSICIVVFITAAVQLSKSSVTATTRSESGSTILNAFQLLDRQVRYADSINFPGVTATASYVEFRTQPQPDSASTVATCTQWRYVPASQLLQSRSWDEGSSPSASWQTRATSVAGLAGTEYPFDLEPSSVSGSAYQRLALKLEAGGAKSEDKTQIDTQFVARNSSISSPSNADANADGKSDTPVCNPSGYRP